MMNDEPGRFFLSTTCRCNEEGCDQEVGAGVNARLDRVAITPDANQPGDVVALVVEHIRFPDGWTLHPDDLKPRCPKHPPTDILEQGA